MIHVAIALSPPRLSNLRELVRGFACHLRPLHCKVNRILHFTIGSPSMTPSPRIRFAKSARQDRSLGLGVIGLGTVGTGTLKVLAEHQEEIQRRLGCDLQLKVICSRSVHKRDLSWLGQPVKITSDWKKVVERSGSQHRGGTGGSSLHRPRHRLCGAGCGQASGDGQQATGGGIRRGVG